MKLLTNSLYGKLASKYFTRATVVIKNDDFATINEMYKLNAVTQLDTKHIILNYNVKPIPNNTVDKDLMKKAFLRANEAISDKDLNIAVAATVTAQGRVQLYQLMKEVVARGGVVCYTDTDSVFCTLPEEPFNKPFGPYT
jgi:DNA polymerase elongation subunit (family B)